MVNETSKPEQSPENEQLGQRLAASNQALANMQTEHRQLLEEMEQLRKRAEDLQRLREQQERAEEEKKLEHEQNIAKTTETLNSKNEEPEEGNIDTAEEANYIKEKLAEIARLKAQFKRVQHMISTTELIENHISKNENAETQLSKEENNSDAKKDENSAAIPTDGITAADQQLITIPNIPSMADLNAATTSDEKEQLILTMLNMFQDFSSDLKSQADNLRAERERIRELKESIIRSRKEQPK